MRLLTTLESVIEGAVLYHSLEVLDKGILGSVDAFLDPLCYERKVHRFLYENKKRGGRGGGGTVTVINLTLAEGDTDGNFFFSTYMPGPVAFLFSYLP